MENEIIDVNEEHCEHEKFIENEKDLLGIIAYFLYTTHQWEHVRKGEDKDKLTDTLINIFKKNAKADLEKMFTILFRKKALELKQVEEKNKKKEEEINKKLRENKKLEKLLQFVEKSKFSTGVWQSVIGAFAYSAFTTIIVIIAVINNSWIINFFQKFFPNSQ